MLGGEVELVHIDRIRAAVRADVAEKKPRGKELFSDHYAWTDVFIKRNGKWLAVASQTTQIK